MASVTHIQTIHVETKHGKMATVNYIIQTSVGGGGNRTTFKERNYIMKHRSEKKLFLQICLL